MQTIKHHELVIRLSRWIGFHLPRRIVYFALIDAAALADSYAGKDDNAPISIDEVIACWLRYGRKVSTKPLVRDER